MKKILSLLIILVVLFGCAAAHRKVSSENLNKIKRIAIIPMESPPLEISPGVSMDNLFGYSSILITAPSQSLQMAGIVGFVVSGIYMLSELPEITKRSAMVGDSIETILDSGEAWIPTVIFARETAKQITANEKYDVVLIQNVQKYHGLENRERTVWMQNWLKPITNWYNEETSKFNYKSFKNQKIDAVLELGICQYGLTKTSITLMVMFKLIDPMTSQILGRNFAFEWSQQETKEILDNNAQKFKEAYSDLGAKLISKNLKNIGLKPE